MNGANGNGLQTAKSMIVLNRLLALFRYSLASYLPYAHPRTRPGNARLLEAVRRVAADHESHARRVGELILKRHVIIGLGGFPVWFTAYNNVSLDYFARLLVAHQRTIVEELARCTAELNSDREAKRLAEHIVAREREHLQSLTELAAPASWETAYPAAGVAA